MADTDPVTHSAKGTAERGTAPGQRHPIMDNAPVCGIVLPSGDRVCILDIDHAGQHGVGRSVYETIRAALLAEDWWRSTPGARPSNVADPIAIALIAERALTDAGLLREEARRG